jgi:hypothetical protein
MSESTKEGVVRALWMPVPSGDVPVSATAIGGVVIRIVDIS